ncbi:shikimate and dehydroshikimate transport protein [Klebsiella pneumoniae]|nr:shikimate and dehydroshikimate transport protein [Klebsiella pneumoniae]
MTIGMLMATFIVSLMTLFDEAQFLAWGWRIPFLLSSVLVFLGLWIRKDIDETPAFKQVKKSGQVAKAPLRDTLKHHWREVLIAAGLKVVETAPLLYLLHLCGQLRHHHPELSEVAGAGIRDPGRAGGHRDDPLMGLLSDKVGRQKMYTPERGAAGAVYRPVVPAARHRHRLGHHAGDDRCLRHPCGRR